MPYNIGISSGLWGIAKAEEIMGILKKIYYATTKGVTFTQVDLDMITEFKEPGLKEGIERIKKMGLEFGIHGEMYEAGMHTLPLDSAIYDDYVVAHQRLLMHIEEAAKIGSNYVSIHSTESRPFPLLGKELQPSKLVDFWGRSLRKLIEESPKLKEWVFATGMTKELWEFAHVEPKEYIERRIKERSESYEAAGRTPTKEEEEKIRKEEREKAEKILLNITDTTELHYGPERFAYFVIAKYMQMNKDPLWMGSVGKILDDKDLVEHPEKWIAAVAVKYLWGHFNPHSTQKEKFKDPKQTLEKNKMYWCFETPMAHPGYETMMRIASPKELYYLAKNMGTEFAGWTLDFEHVMSCNLDPKQEIEKLPYKAGELLKVVHITFPTPLHPSHMPVPLSSEAQVYLYERLLELRKKGFKDGWIIFERGGGEDPVKQTILVMRQIVQFLEREVESKDLPPEFFGVKLGGPELTRQEVVIREHALDPLKGLLSVPEEEHGFLGRTAMEKGKAEEWRKEKYK